MSISLTAQPCLMKTLTRSSALNDTGFSWHLKKMAFLFLTLLEWIRCSKNSLHSQLFLLTLRPRLTMKRKPSKNLSRLYWMRLSTIWRILQIKEDFIHRGWRRFSNLRDPHNISYHTEAESQRLFYYSFKLFLTPTNTLSLQTVC